MNVCIKQIVQQFTTTFSCRRRFQFANILQRNYTRALQPVAPVLIKVSIHASFGTCLEQSGLIKSLLVFNC